MTSIPLQPHSGDLHSADLRSRSARSHRVSVSHIEGRSEFLRPPKWRTRTTPARRAVAAAITFGIVVAIGAAVLALMMGTLAVAGAPRSVVALPWLAPTVIVLVWNQHRPGAAIPSDDDDDSWVGYAVRYVLVGAGEPRPRPVRIVAALAFGAPVGWVACGVVVLQLIGFF